MKVELTVELEFDQEELAKEIQTVLTPLQEQLARMMKEIAARKFQEHLRINEADKSCS